MTKIRPSGGYRQLHSFKAATIIYDATYWFCEKFITYPRMSDQMIQAARSGRQNIAEGNRASATSSQTELRLFNVARSSLEELLLDYEDFLRQRRLRIWAANDEEAVAVHNVAQSNGPDSTDEQRHAKYAKWLDSDDPAMRVNALICLIHQANFLLDKYIQVVEKQFIEEGGYSEQLATLRLVKREQKQKNRSDGSDRSDQIPRCPSCGKSMVLRTAKNGKNAGKQFWGCTAYPDCKGLVDL